MRILGGFTVPTPGQIPWHNGSARRLQTAVTSETQGSRRRGEGHVGFLHGTASVFDRFLTMLPVIHDQRIRSSQRAECGVHQIARHFEGAAAVPFHLGIVRKMRYEFAGGEGDGAGEFPAATHALPHTDSGGGTHKVIDMVIGPLGRHRRVRILCREAGQIVQQRLPQRTRRPRPAPELPGRDFPCQGSRFHQHGFGFLT